jgi:NSS family neurotransmitter:Na+ symporter
MAIKKTAKPVPRAPRSLHGLWSTPGVFVLASVGYVVGLNNIWQFPYHATQYGGGAFVFFYVLFLGLLGLPLMMAQVMLGRLVRMSPVNTVATLVKRHRLSQRWVGLGWLAVATGFLVLTYFSVIAGWMVAYVVRALSGALYGLTSDGAGAVFSSLVRDPEKQLFWHSLFILMTMLVVARGVRHGLEPVMRYAVPLMLGLLVVLMVYSSSVGGLTQAAGALLVPDFNRLTGDGILTALGDAFFSLGLGTGVMMMYGAYLPAHASVARLSAVVVGADVVVGILAGLVVLPLVFDAGNDLVGGAELVFQMLAVVFDPLPLGGLLRVLFFILLTLVAWLSAIALIEPMVAWLVESREISRSRAVLYCGVALWLLGLMMILSFNYWKFSFSVLGQAKSLGLLDIMVIMTSNIMLPVTAILSSLFAGWALTSPVTQEAMALRSPCTYDIWLWLVRVVVPISLLLVLFNMRLFL